MFKLLYKPFGFIAGIVAGLIGRRVFDYTWGKLDDEEPPKGTTQEANWPKILGAAALQGLVFQTTRVVIDRYAATGWHYVTGSWPGEKHPAPLDGEE